MMAQPRRVVILLGSLLLSSGCQVVPTTTPPPTDTSAQSATAAASVGLDCTSTATSGLTLRAGPDQAYPAILVLSSGAGVISFFRSDDRRWMLVRTTNGSTGWIAADFVRCSGDLTSLPIVPEPPVPRTSTIPATASTVPDR